MAYTTRNFKTKAELKRAAAAGEAITVYQPNDMFNQTAKMREGRQTVYLEGPHYPQPHRASNGPFSFSPYLKSLHLENICKSG